MRKEERAYEMVVDLYFDDVLGFDALAASIGQPDAEAARASKKLLDDGEAVADELAGV
ncbi:hypothetical protein R3751_04245 [Halorubrum distributum]|uniref:Uncharacterized protein n=1 Tax=Halorubrum distributum JCM 10247 TaxID=1227486 RepID=M0DCB5_9EURY|nr:MULTISPECIES: hypothetical protein [Halorubrum distributum group]ELZ33106.1 hypothetical protein C473_07924 [Halorubrum terrestre JCM 10247]MDV7348988.1 hypothetical protein [Halorubrum distributum]